MSKKADDSKRMLKYVVYRMSLLLGISCKLSTKKYFFFKYQAKLSNSLFLANLSAAIATS